MEKINDGGPAFPGCNPNPGLTTGGEGMSLRDYFAAKAMQTIHDVDYRLECNSSYDDMARWAYQLADAMLAAREAKL